VHRVKFSLTCPILVKDVVCNCATGPKVMIVGHTTLCGGVDIAEETWIGAGVNDRHNLSIGKREFVGLSEVDTKGIAVNVIVTGSAERIMEQRICAV